MSHKKQQMDLIAYSHGTILHGAETYRFSTEGESLSLSSKRSESSDCLGHGPRVPTSLAVVEWATGEIKSL